MLYVYLSIFSLVVSIISLIVALRLDYLREKQYKEEQKRKFVK